MEAKNDLELIVLCLEGQADETSQILFKERLNDPVFRRLVLDFEVDGARIPRLLLELEHASKSAARKSRISRWAIRLTLVAAAALILIASWISFGPVSPDLPRVVSGAAGWPEPGRAVKAGREYVVPEAAAVEVAYGDGSKLQLAAGTRLSFDAADGKTLILTEGALSAQVSPQAAARPMHLRCPQAEAKVVGTRFTLAAEEGRSLLRVEHGQVRFGDSRTSALVKAGQQAQADARQPILAQTLARDDAKSLARWKTYSQKLRFDPAMVAYFDFQEGKGETLHCGSPGGQNGKISQAQWMAGRWTGKHSLLLGPGQQVDIGDSERLRLKSPCSVFVWFCVKDWTLPYHALISKGLGSWRIQRGINSPGLEFAASGLEPNVVYGKIPVNDHQWHLGCGVYDGTSLAIYVDGRLDQQLPCQGQITQNQDRSEIGANRPQPHPNANCWLDEVGILDRALTETEVKDLWEAGRP